MSNICVQRNFLLRKNSADTGVRAINMKKKYYIIICYILNLLFCINVCYADDAVFNLLKESYPNHTIKDPNILADDLKKTFEENIKTPTTVIADFDGNNLKDYAFILKNIKNGENLFLVYLQTSKNNFKEIEIMRGNTIFDYIEIVEPNTLVESMTAVETHAKPIIIKNHAIMAIYYGKSSAVYYWDNNSKSFVAIWTSD